MQFQSLETTLEQFLPYFYQKNRRIAGANDPEFSLLHTVSLTFSSTGTSDRYLNISVRLE